MIELNTAQQAAVDARSKIVTWLFDLTITDDSTRRMSTKSTSYGGHDYTGDIIDWVGVTMRRSQAETGIVAPSDISLSIIANDLTIVDLDGASLTVRLLIDGGAGPVEIRAWRYIVTGIQPAYGTIKLTAQIFITSALSGSWPRAATSLAAFPEADVSDDGYCVPVVFGQAFIPMRSVLSSGHRHYLLGPSGPTYTINKVRAPRDSGVTTEWDAGSYSMSQSTQGAYRTFRPIVADADSDGTPDSQGLWQTGGRYLDPLVQFSRSDTAGLTNPADIIEYILRDIGLGDADIDAAAFAAAKTTFAAWGLEWHFGLWTKQDRQKLLAQLLTACAATLDVGVRVGLRVLGGPVGVVGLGDVIRTSKNGPGTFGYSSKTASAEDAGYIGWRQSTSPEDELLRVLVPVDDSTDNPSTNILALGMITNPDHAQRIGSIYYQRKLTGKAAIVATLSSVWAGLQAGDTVTISPAMYGGPYPVEIDSVTIGKDLQIEIRATRYACTISQFSGLSFSSISLAIDSSTNPNNVWRLPSSGPDGAVGLNAMTGRLRIGDDIVLDAGAGALEMGNLTEGPGMSYRDGVLQLLGAALRIAASAAADVRSDLNVENGATAGATWGVNVSGQPTSLADLDATAANELDGKAVTFYQEEEPTGSTGDIWFDTNNNYRMYRYDGTSWVAVQDSAAASAAAQTAQNNADLAQATADGKVVTFYQTTAPTADGTGDLWYNSDDKKLKRWDGSSWDEVSNAFNNTSELTDGASLGLTATWSNVSGSGKPADNADKTKTVIDGGLITTGTIKDADDSLVINFSDKTITFYNTLKLNNYSEIYAPSIGTLMLVIASEQDIRIQSDQEVFLSGTAVRTNTLSRINADGGYGPSIEGTQFLTKLNELTNDWELHVKHNGTYRGHVVLV